MGLQVIRYYKWGIDRALIESLDAWLNLVDPLAWCQSGLVR